MTISAKTLDDLGWSQLIEHLCRRTHTARGQAAAAALAFFDRIDDARERVAEIEEARALAALEAPLPFGGIQDVETAVARADKGGTLEPAELLAVASTARGLARLRKHLDQHAGDAPRLAALTADIADLGHVYEPIEDAFDAHGQLADHASPALGPLRRTLAQQQGQLERRMRSMVDDARISPHLQDRFFTMRDDRYVVPVRVDARSRVRGIVHGTSQSGQTVFVEPEEIVELGNRVKLAECDVHDEEQRILAALSALVAAEITRLLAGAEAAVVLDVIAAGASLADATEAAPPVIEPAGAGGALRLSRARHPLMVLSSRGCVPNDILMEPATVLIISGPNAGGKTVCLKTAGLAALMARAGLHIAADPGSAVPWFETVHSDIGDSQSLENDLSTFSAHLVKLRMYLDQADEHTLILIDEIAAGTEPEQGAALAQAVLESLAERRVTALVATHYERLKARGARGQGFANASVGFDLETMAPTFRLHLGVPGSSGALAVARRMGLPAPVLDHAQELLGERRASIEELLAEVADERRRLQDERAALATLRDETERARRQAELARDTAREYERKLKQGAHTDAVAALRRARDELDQVRAAVKRRVKVQTGGELEQAKKRVAELAGAIAEHAPRRPTPAGAAATLANVRPGATVYVASLGSRGQVVEVPPRGKVLVQVGTMKTTVALADLLVVDASAAGGAQGGGAPAQASARSGQKQKRERGAHAAPGPAVDMVKADHEGRAYVRTPEVTLDVRGERADDAVDAVDRFIDQSLMSERDLIFVIHGHGTGALRSAVRGHLSAHRAVTSWRPGERAEGGDGVTVAWLQVD